MNGHDLKVLDEFIKKIENAQCGNTEQKGGLNEDESEKEEITETVK